MVRDDTAIYRTEQGQLPVARLWKKSTVLRRGPRPAAQRKQACWPPAGPES